MRLRTVLGLALGAISAFVVLRTWWSARATLEFVDRTTGAGAPTGAAREAALEAFGDTFLYASLGTMGLGIVMLALIGWAVTRYVQRPIHELTVHAGHVAQGNFATVQVRGVHELTELADAASLMAARLAAEDRKRGRHAELLEALATGGGAREVGDRVLATLVARYDVLSAVLWAHDHADRVVQIAATGVEATGQEPPSVVREALASGQPRRFDAPPAGRHEIRTSSATVAPVALLAVPLPGNGGVLGVLDLALARVDRVEAAEIERAAVAIGLALGNALHAQRVGQLAEELQEAIAELRSQNDELRAQEEELRSQSAELGAQQEQLVRANQEVLSGSQHKTTFLTTMSHELRTPLNAILGFSEVLLSGTQGPLNEAQRASMADVHNAGRHLLMLIEDVLDLSRVEAGRLDLRSRPTSVKAVAHEAMGLVSPQAQRGGVRLVNEAADAPWYVLGDPDRLRQVLVNLLSNAVKFTPEGGEVRITTRAEAGMVHLEVVDTGVGIDPADIPRLFKPFSQLEHTQPGTGTGLGLAISKRLIELMDGDIGVVSQRGSGARFWVTVPECAAVAPTATEPVDGPATVLLVEDQPADRRLVTGVLASMGYEVQAVPDAETALTQLELARPGVLVVDLGLPGMSGLALSERVRARWPDLRILVLTARELDEHEREPLRKLADEIVVKGSLTQADFVSRLGRWLKPTPAPIATRRRVLVVEDNAVNRRVVRAMLEAEGCVVVEAEDGEMALRVAVDERPDLVLMDLQMPGMDGFEATRRLRADVRTAALPIIALSAHAMAQAMDAARAAGCDGFVPKPVARADLFRAITAALTARSA